MGAGARSGAVTLIQRFGSALNLNIHLHTRFIDGAYTFEEERLRFHGGSAPTRPELRRLLCIIATRVTRALERQGMLLRNDEPPSLDLEPDDGFEPLLAAAVHYCIATGAHTGRKALTLRTVASNSMHSCARISPRRSSGTRMLLMMTSTMSWTSSPRRTRCTGEGADPPAGSPSRSRRSVEFEGVRSSRFLGYIASVTGGGN